MCGLVGIAGNTGGKPKDMFTELLVVDSLRGMHSTGMAVIKRYMDETILVKRASPSQLLIGEQAYKNAMNQTAKVIIGHNRYATKGAHTEQNAHPFAFNHVVGAHNGTLDHFSIKHLHNNEKYDTDSQAIFAHINEYGIEEAIKQMSGAWALTWYDRRDNTMNFLRNSQRPLFYAYSKERDLLIWASEVEMLDFTLTRNHLKYEGIEFFTVEKDTHVSWVVPTEPTGKFGVPDQIERKAPSVFVTQGYQRPKGQWNGNQSEDCWEAWAYGDSGCAWEDKDKSSSTFHNHSVTQGSGSTVAGGQGVIVFPKANPKSGSSIVRVDTSKFRPPYKIGPHKAISKPDFYKIVNQGCVYCSDNNSDWGEFIQILPDKVPDGTHLFLCEQCYNNDEIHELCNCLIEN